MTARAGEPVVIETRPELGAALDALGMPPAGLRRWLERNQAFCHGHGGRRYYAELLDLYQACLRVLDGRER